MTKKFKVGDRVTTKTESVYEKTQESLNGKMGTVVNTDDYPYNIHVRVDSMRGKPIIGFSEFELNMFHDHFTVDAGITIQKTQLNQWKTVLKRDAYMKLVEYATEKNHEAKNGWGIRRGSDLDNFVANLKNK